MHPVSTLRLWILRAAYLIVAVGLAFMIGPLVISHPADVPHMTGVVRSMLGAVFLLAVLGILQPLRMLPVLLFEFVWKAIWLLSFALPARSAGLLTGPMLESWNECLIGVVFVALVIPWGYVVRTYFRVDRGEAPLPQ